MAPDAVFASATDRSDFLKFTKFFGTRGVLIIVHSRKGVKVETNYKKPNMDTDWFNLSIEDCPDVIKATKAVISEDILETFEKNLCVEITLKTIEGDEMVLETWVFHVDKKADPDYGLKAMSTVYYRMGILLKSLITVTRTTPGYKLSRRQSPDSYSVYYYVHTGQPRVECLGEDYSEKPVGTLKTPIGALSITCLYRTNMTIPPNKQKPDLLLKSDHFDLSPKHIVYGPCKKEANEKVPLDLSKPMRIAAFVDTEEVGQYVSTYEKNIPKPKNRSPVTSVTLPKPVEVPQLIEKSATPMESPPRRYSWFRSEKDHPLQLLQCPFADREPKRDLAEFYQEFFNAPQLKALQENTADEVATPESPEDDIDLSKQLEEFENSAYEFDKMIESMYHVDAN